MITLEELSEWLEEHAGELSCERFRGRWTVTICGPRGALLARANAETWSGALLRAVHNLEQGVHP